MKSGIYCIENLKNGKKYIGQTVDLERREKAHFSELSRNCHYNSHLQLSYKKYGEKSFIFKILLYCESFELTKYEQFFVNSFPKEDLYNICLECTNSWFGLKHTKEAKEKMSKNHANFSKENHPMWGIRGEFHPLYGISRKHTEKTKEKMSKNHANVSGKNNPNYGNNHSKEVKKKISEANGGENSSLSKLKANQVFNILNLYYNKKVKQKDISDDFSITPTTVSNICTGRTWKQCHKKFMENYKNESQT